MSKSGNNDGCAPGTDLQSRRALAMKGINELPAFVSQFTEADVPFEGAFSPRTVGVGLGRYYTIAQRR
jgi:hypothetical protein